MNFNLGDIFVTLKTKNAELHKGLKDSEGKMQSLGDSASRAFKSAQESSKLLLGAVTAVAGAAVVFGKKSVDAYFAAQEAQTKLRTNMLNVKGATEAQVQSLDKLAGRLQSIGVIEDDVIKAGMSQLATFNLQASTIGKLTPKITDMVAQLKGHNATAEDMVAINNLVGKVITGNVGALSRYGVTLSENQKELIKNGDEATKAATIVEVLGQNYGAVNEQLRQTPQGKITGLKNRFGDLQEKVGEFIVDALTPLVDKFDGWVKKIEDAGGPMEYLKNLFEDNKDKVILLTGAIAGGLVPAIISLAGAVGRLMLSLGPFMLIGAALFFLWNKNKLLFAVLTGAVIGLGIAIMVSLLPALTSATVGFLTLAASMFLAALPFVLIGAAIGLLVYLVIKYWDQIRETIGKVVEKIKGWFDNLPGWIKTAFLDLARIITAPFRNAFNLIAFLWNNTVGKLKFKIPKWVPGIGGKGIDMPDLPYLALGTPDFAGGLANMNEFGPETAVLPPGTRVITADQTRQNDQGRAGDTYVINIKGAMVRSESELADVMYKGIKALDRRLVGAGQPQIIQGDL